MRAIVKKEGACVDQQPSRVPIGGDNQFSTIVLPTDPENDHVNIYTRGSVGRFIPHLPINSKQIRKISKEQPKRKRPQ